MARVTPLSGFPEWLPDGRVVEQHVLDVLRRTFELHGFAGIETRAVEPLDQLLRKGETSKEVYVLRRLQEEGEDTSADGGRGEKQLGLHFDLTVPFARYVLENAGRLAFPFKRYQIQKVWRGERPQEGRFREFVQADIDVVGAGELPYHYEVEVPLVMAEALGALREVGLPPVRVLVNNRKVAEGFYRGLGLSDVEGVLRQIDKLDKIGVEKVAELLVAEQGATAEQAAACLDLAAIHGSDTTVVDDVRKLAARYDAATDLLETGLAELGALIEAAGARAPGVVVADLKIARGLDYYTGSVYETVLVGHEQLGSICSGGRYDTLASDGKNTYPGVGLSVGVSRLVSRLLSAGLMTATRGVPTAVLVAVTDEDHRAQSDAVAAALRARGIPTDVAPSAAKFGRQIKVADRRGIPFVWFPGEEHQVKDIRSGEQVEADPTTWAPPAEDLHPRVVPGE
ncbi:MULTISPECIES: histidine--tRNA ligase [unclassified Isoptericola]|uniref:histidine--tRNA ligase n=1 Tax=unclassified Isoptericola TaxID=2623355 RepID=UPI002712E41F|nr:MULTISPECIES: histidine--tRNA ligase [unclassified Isoptericola]MDO8145058.1 histidine--tRNA ligase [Isoptericola sp. 178]MDO8148692.1 histidine--tRNA ligase [Isoptericola sp. b515]MDO8151362.1 histidine--tRNA ligase [Isoptericola sp. b408]